MEPGSRKIVAAPRRRLPPSHRSWILKPRPHVLARVQEGTAVFSLLPPALDITRPTMTSRHECLDLQSFDGREVLHVGGEHRQLMLDGGGGDEGIAHLQPVAQGE